MPRVSPWGASRSDALGALGGWWRPVVRDGDDRHRLPEAADDAAAIRSTCSDVSDPVDAPDEPSTASGSRQLLGRGVHPGLSAIGPNARISSDDRCNTDLPTLATPASRTLTRPGARGHGGHWNRWRRSCRCAGRRESANDSSFFRCRGRTVGGDEHAANAARAAAKTEDHRLVVGVRGALEPRCRFGHGVARAVCVAASVAAQLSV